MPRAVLIFSKIDYEHIKSWYEKEITHCLGNIIFHYQRIILKISIIYPSILSSWYCWFYRVWSDFSDHNTVVFRFVSPLSETDA